MVYDDKRPYPCCARSTDQPLANVFAACKIRMEDSTTTNNDLNSSEDKENVNDLITVAISEKLKCNFFRDTWCIVNYA